MRPSTFVYSAFLAASNVNAEKATLVVRDVSGAPSAIAKTGQPVSQGCYQSQGNMTVHSGVIYMSSAGCSKACTDDNFWVAGLHGPQCWCGYALPAKDDMVDDSECNVPCPAWKEEACGGSDAWSVLNLGVNLTPPRYESASSTSKGSKTSSASSTATAGSATSEGTTIVTETSVPVESSKPDDDKKKGGPNVAGIAAGVVVGVVAAGALIGGIFFYIRRKRNAEIEEEHRRNAAVNAFISGSKPPSSNGSVSMTDARLDPVMAHRRMSDGSIADNEDYSRRILRVTNA